MHPGVTDTCSFHYLQAGMVEFIGILKVKVLNGTNLAIRDMLSSDPYVVLTLGKQVSNNLEQILGLLFR